MRILGIALFLLCVGAAGCAEETSADSNAIGQEQQPAKHVDAASCGGFGGVQCAKGYTCADKPNDACNPDNGDSDCPGVCIQATTSQLCGGFANLPCSDGLTCVDNPDDDCDPNNGGADCGGICIKKN